MQATPPIVTAALVLVLAAHAPVGFGQGEQEYTHHAVTAPDGVTLSVQEWGNPDGAAILFVHGYAQSHLNWQEQVRDAALAEEFRMVTFDLRGHGTSDQPAGAAYYHESERWAGDVAAILDSLDLADPVIVASSMGGRVAGDYLGKLCTSSS